MAKKFGNDELKRNEQKNNKKIYLSPATSSPSLTATLVDVTGLAIYFTTATVILKGTIL